MIIAVPLMERVGRRATLILFYLCGGIACIAVGALTGSWTLRFDESAKMCFFSEERSGENVRLSVGIARQNVRGGSVLRYLQLLC